MKYRNVIPNATAVVFKKKYFADITILKLRYAGDWLLWIMLASKGNVSFSSRRKGYEFVPLIMKKIIIEKGIRDIQFTWIGADKNSTEYCILKHDIQKLHLQTFFNCTTPVNSIESLLAQLDVLVLPSREDAFPLVVLEAAHYEVPCIYFSNAGGISEFSGSDAGIEIDYLDFDTMSEKIIELKKNNEFRRSLGKRSKEKVLAYSDNKQIVEDLLKYFD
jgi:glycosyltransferase involved in cell wall biosynthesis